MKKQCEITKRRIDQRFFVAAEQHSKTCSECCDILKVAGNEECMEVQNYIWSKRSNANEKHVEKHCQTCLDCKRFFEVSKKGECKKIQHLITLNRSDDRNEVEEHCKDCYPCFQLLDLADDVGADNIEGI